MFIAPFGQQQQLVFGANDLATQLGRFFDYPFGTREQREIIECLLSSSEIRRAKVYEEKTRKTFLLDEFVGSDRSRRE